MSDNEKSVQRSVLHRANHNQPLESVAAAQSQQRRQRLRVALKLLVTLGVLGILYVMLASFLTIQPDEKDFESQRVDASSQAPGEMTLFNWNGRPVLILRRSQAQLTVLKEGVVGLLDPQGDKSEQPDFAEAPFRSRVPEWFIAIALGTDLSCAIEWVPENNEIIAGKPWPGGFADSCNGYRYDLAGRVYSGQRAKRNLPVPPYVLEPNGVILLGTSSL